MMLGDRFLPVPATLGATFTGTFVADEAVAAQLRSTFVIMPSRFDWVRAHPHKDFRGVPFNGTNPAFQVECCDFGGHLRGNTTVTVNGVRRRVEFHGQYAPGMSRGGGYFMMHDLPVPPFTAATAPVRIGFLEVRPLP